MSPAQWYCRRSLRTLGLTASALCWPLSLGGCSTQSTPLVQASLDPHLTAEAPNRTASSLARDGAKSAAQSAVSALEAAVAAARVEQVETAVAGAADESPAVAPTAADEDAAAQFERPQPEVVEVAQLPPSALPAVNATAFVYAADDAGRLVGEFFAVPRPLPRAPLETIPQDRPWPRSAERPPADLLPPADFSGARVVPLERSTLAHSRPVLDLPPLGVEYELTRPERPALPLAEKTELNGADPNQAPALPLLARMNEGPLPLAEDATAEPFTITMLAPLGPQRTGGIPFYPPSRLNPLAHAHELELASPPADADPPARNTTPPPAPVLP